MNDFQVSVCSEQIGYDDAYKLNCNDTDRQPYCWAVTWPSIKQVHCQGLEEERNGAFRHEFKKQTKTLSSPALPRESVKVLTRNRIIIIIIIIIIRLRKWQITKQTIETVRELFEIQTFLSSHRKNQQDTTVQYNILFQCFLIAQHVSGDTPPIIRSSKL